MPFELLPKYYNVTKSTRNAQDIYEGNTYIFTDT